MLNLFNGFRKKRSIIQMLVTIEIYNNMIDDVNACILPTYDNRYYNPEALRKLEDISVRNILKFKNFKKDKQDNDFWYWNHRD